MLLLKKLFLGISILVVWIDVRIMWFESAKQKTHDKIAQKSTVAIGRNGLSAKSKRDPYSYRKVQSVYAWGADNFGKSVEL